MKVGQALHASGVASFELEQMLKDLALRLGVRAQFSCTPTSIEAAFGPLKDQRGRMVRVRPSETNLSRLCDLHWVVDGLKRGEISVEDGFGAIREIERGGAHFSATLTVACFAITSAFVSCFFGATVEDFGASFVAGAIVGLLAVLSERNEQMGLLFEPMAAMSVALVAGWLTRWDPSLSPYVIIVSGVIVLLPGLMFTSAIAEIATRNLTSGTARSAMAMFVLLMMGFGAALGIKLSGLELGALGASSGSALPEYFVWRALFVLPVTNLVLFRARLRDLFGITLAGWTAYLGAMWGAQTLGPELGVCVGACMVGLLGHVFTRRYRRPAALILLPGLIVRVPGSVGFSGMTLLSDSNVVSGMQAFFEMSMIAASLVSGLLFAHLIATTLTRSAVTARE